MKKLLLILLLVLSAVETHSRASQIDSVETHSRVSQQTPALNEWSLSAGETRLYEPTLSPQQYKGWSLGFRGEHSNLYRKTTTVGWTFRDRFRYGYLINASQSALMHYGAIDFTYGTHYLFRPLKDFDIRLGGALQLFGDIKYLSRNVNNIASANVSFSLLATLALSYDAQLTPDFRLGASYTLESPLLGCRFTPNYGESYYEIYLRLPDLSQNVAFTSLHNHQAISGNLRLNFTFNDKGVLFLAFTHDHDYFRHSNSLFYVNDLSGSIGFALRLGTLDVK